MPSVAYYLRLMCFEIVVRPRLVVQAKGNRASAPFRRPGSASRGTLVGIGREELKIKHLVGPVAANARPHKPPPRSQRGRS